MATAADAYVSERTHRELVKTHFLIDSARGNLVLRVTYTETFNAAIAPRLIAAITGQSLSSATELFYASRGPEPDENLGWHNLPPTSPIDRRRRSWTKPSQ